MSGYRSFAHLLGLGRNKAARGAKADADDPIVDDYQNDDPLDEQYAEDQDDDAQGRKARKAKSKARRAEDDADDADAEDEDPDAEDEDETPRSRKAKGRARGKRAAEDEDDADAEDEDDDPAAEDEDDGKSAKAIRRRAVKAERERCARIIAHGIKTGNVEQAAALAFDSNLSPKAAAGVLGLAQASKPGQTLASRMQGVNVPSAGLGDSGKPAGMSDMAAAIIAAGADAHGN